MKEKKFIMRLTPLPQYAANGTQKHYYIGGVSDFGDDPTKLSPKSYPAEAKGATPLSLEEIGKLMAYFANFYWSDQYTYHLKQA